MNDSPSVSEQARDAAGGVPDQNWGAQGTTDIPPHIPQAPQASNPGMAVSQAARGPLANVPVAPIAPVQPQATQTSPNYAAPALQTLSVEERVDTLEQDIQTIASAVGTVLEKLDAALGQTAPVPAQPTPGMATNTGQLGGMPGEIQGYNPAPGTATPAAPVPHSPAQTARYQRQQGPVIPLPDPQQQTPQNPGQKRVLSIPQDEANLTIAQYIEKHFRMRDQSIDEMAELLRIEPIEVTDILKELGYQFPSGV